MLQCGWLQVKCVWANRACCQGNYRGDDGCTSVDCVLYVCFSLSTGCQTKIVAAD